jgi:cytochrome c-type biogenesis protein
MITALVSAVSAALSTPSGWAFGAALIWGILSVILSPCHLGAIPLIVGYINDGQRPTRRRAFECSLIFALGLLVTLGIIGVLTSAAGRLLGDIGAVPKALAAAFLILCGLGLMDLPPFSRISVSVRPGRTERGHAGALVLGLLYGVLLGPCSFAFLAPMLGFVFAAGRAQTAYGASLMAVYAVGHTAAVTAAGTFGDYIAGLLRRRGSETAARWFKRFLGAIVVAAGTLQILG